MQKELDQAAETCHGSVFVEGCLAGVEVPTISTIPDKCATFEDDVLFCSSPVPDVFQMCSCSSRCCSIVPAFMYMM